MEVDMRGRTIGKRLAACLLSVALAAGMLAGCGGKGSTEAGIGESKDGTDAGTDEQGTAMGRYVEKDVELNGSALTDWNSRLFKQADGSYLLADNSGFVLRSTDNGESWTKENLP